MVVLFVAAPGTFVLLTVNLFAFRIWDAQFEILRFEIMKTDRTLIPCDAPYPHEFQIPDENSKHNTKTIIKQ